MSGVPQGSVLGPSLFLAYINDLPDSLKSRVRFFADDTILYLTINSKSDPETLQNDLNTLEKWEEDWSMEFNADKCEVIRITIREITSFTPINYIILISKQQIMHNILVSLSVMI